MLSSIAGMRIAILDTYYGAFLSDFYKKRPSSYLESAAEHKRSLFGAAFGCSNFYSKSLKELGHEAEEFIINDEPLQLHWATEHGVSVPWQYPLLKRLPRVRRIPQKIWQETVLLAQLDAFQPSIIYCQKINALSPQYLTKIKKRYGCMLVGQIASQLPDRSAFEPYDLLISALHQTVHLFQSWGKTSEYLPLAFEPTVLQQIPNLDSSFDVTHVGGYGPIHDERNQILERVAQKIKLDCWGYGIGNIAKNSPLLQNYHGTSWGMDMYAVLQNSKITLTKHITSVAGDEAANQTLYEATGTGCLLITDNQKTLPSLFQPGKEVETYDTIDELIEKIYYYLNNEQARTAIASAGQARTLRDHTYFTRMQQLSSILLRYA